MVFFQRVLWQCEKIAKVIYHAVMRHRTGACSDRDRESRWQP